MFLAVCGGYQLLGRFYRDVAGAELPGIGLLPLHTVAGERRMIGDVLLECALGRRDPRGVREPRGPHDPRRRRRAARTRRLRASGTTAPPASRAAATSASYGTYLHGPLLPRNPWFADRLLEEALAHAGVDERFEPLADELEHEAHAVSAARARSRGGALSRV